MARTITHPGALELWERFQKAEDGEEQYSILGEIAKRMDDESLDMNERADFACIYLDAKHEIQGPASYDLGG